MERSPIERAAAGADVGAVLANAFYPLAVEFVSVTRAAVIQVAWAIFALGGFVHGWAAPAERLAASEQTAARELNSTPADKTGREPAISRPSPDDSLAESPGLARSVESADKSVDGRADWPAGPADVRLPTPAETLSLKNYASAAPGRSAADHARSGATTSLPLGGWLALSLLSLAPAALLMTTSYVRIAAVLGLLRQALGMPQLPSTTVISSLSLFMTFLVMAPVWTEVYEEAIVPARDPARRMSWDEFWTKGSQPLRRFMSRQIDRADNSEDVWLFYRHLPESRTAPPPATYDDVPLAALLPAFLLSELKVAFLIGFQICLPFLVVDLVVASMTTALGMMMIPTQAISLPMKLLLFVLLDGWRLVVGLLLESFQA
jgi:flagellar biosynthetic protein FliP